MFDSDYDFADCIFISNQIEIFMPSSTFLAYRNTLSLQERAKFLASKTEKFINSKYDDKTMDLVMSVAKYVDKNYKKWKNEIERGDYND